MHNSVRFHFICKTCFTYFNKHFLYRSDSKVHYLSTVLSEELRSVYFVIELLCLCEHSWEFSNTGMSLSVDEVDALLFAVFYHHHNTCQTVYPQFLQPVTDTGWGRLAQQSTFCLEQEPDLENVVSSTPVRPPGTLFLPTFTTLLIPALSENDSRVHFLIVLIPLTIVGTPGRRPTNAVIDWLID